MDKIIFIIQVEWKSIELPYWVQYIHIELIDYGTSSCECDSIDNNKLNEKVKLSKELNESKYINLFCILYLLFIK